MTGVAPDPAELDLVCLAQHQQFFPEVDVHGALLVCAPPLLTLPGFHPALVHRIHKILRVAVERDAAGLVQHFQSLDRGVDLHAVVGGATKSAAGFRPLLGMHQYHAITAGTGIGVASPVGEDLDVMFRCLCWFGIHKKLVPTRQRFTTNLRGVKTVSLNSNPMKRRQFIKHVAQATATLSAVSAFSGQRVIGANDRVRLGLIGCGGRGLLLTRLVREVPNVEVVAVCDVFDPAAEEGRSVASSGAKVFRDFRRILEMDDVDGILVATPDHWHAIPTVLGCQAGKDVYVEKPLGLTIREGRAMVEAAREYDRVVQTGLQHRSAPHYKEVEEIVQSGGIGEVHYVHVCNYSTVYTSQNVPADTEPPEELDWDMYLGPAPKVPYNPLRFRAYRRFYDYSGGFITDFGAHRLDSVHQVMHDDQPLSAMGAGGLHGPESIVDTPNVLHVTYEYRDWILAYEAIQLNDFGTGPRIHGGRRPYRATEEGSDRPHGEAFYGTKGTIFSDRWGYELYPAGGNGKASKSVKGEDETDLQLRNFIECVRSRERPVADVEIGHKSTIVPHLGNISYRIGGRKIYWDGERERIINDPEAAAMLSRQARPPWNLI